MPAASLNGRNAGESMGCRFRIMQPCPLVAPIYPRGLRDRRSLSGLFRSACRHIHEHAVNPVVAGKLRVKRRGQQVPLPDRYRVPVGEGREHFDRLSGFHDDRGPDEYCAERPPVQSGYVEIRFEAIDLTPEPVSRRSDVQQSERFRIWIDEPPRQDDHPRTGAPHGHAIRDGLRQGSTESPAVHQFSDGRALSSGNYQAVQTHHVLREPYLNGRDAHVGEHRDVLPKVTLEGQNAYPGLPYCLRVGRCPGDDFGYHPRVSSRASSARLEVSMPLIGSPRPAEILASTSGSW